MEAEISVRDLFQESRGEITVHKSGRMEVLEMERSWWSSGIFW